MIYRSVTRPEKATDLLKYTAHRSGAIYISPNKKINVVQLIVDAAILREGR